MNDRHELEERPPSTGSQARGTSIAIGLIATAALFGGYLLMLRAEAQTSRVALAASAKPVAVVAAKAATFQRSRRYVGTLLPWVEAEVGPQLVSAYVDTVLVRPGVFVKRGEVLATLDCRNASTAKGAIAMQARAIEARQKAIADEAARQEKLLKGGYASTNEVEQAVAQSQAESARLEAQKATLAQSSLEVSDCVLRAPFDGEVGDRYIDPGGFVRPGTAVVSLVDRSTVRFVCDVPEADFSVVAPKTPVRIRVDATGETVDGAIARRAPHADLDTRTVRFEVDLPDKDRVIPVDTTGEAAISFGDTLAATEIPLYAATVRGSKVTVFEADGMVAHLRTVTEIGESGGSLFVDRTLEPGKEIVTEGRALLTDGDRIAPKADSICAPAPSGSAR